MIYYFVVRLGGTNGADQAAADILTCLTATNMPITIFCQDKSQIPRQIDDIAANRIIWMKTPRFATFPNRSDKKFFKNLVKWLIFNSRDIHLHYKLRKHLRNHKPRLSIFNDLIPDASLAKQLRKTGKLVGIIHDSPEFLKFFLELFKVTDLEHQIDLFAETAAETCNALIFVSPKGRDEWKALKPLATKETYVIPHCCREEEVRRLLQQDKMEVRKKLGIDPKRFVVVCVGNLIPRKGQDLLIDVLPHIVEVIPDSILYFVGHPGHGEAKKWSEALYDRAVEVGLTDHVVFVGPREDAMDFIYAADVLALPSRAEAQGIVILEAMALKVPVVAAEIGGIPELIQHDENGLLFPVGDVQRLLKNIERLYGDATLRQNLATNASDIYWQRYSQAKQLARYNEVVGKLLESNQR